MITLGELEFLREMGFETQNSNIVKQCRYRQAGPYVTHCEELLQREQSHAEQTALWHGGGNWGDLWRSGTFNCSQPF